MDVNVKDIKKLRELTGLGIADCKNALLKAQGDIEKAIKILSSKSKDIAQAKQGREVSQGVISAYIHSNKKIGVLVELLCETDFVARLPEFEELAHEIALQVAATNPLWLSKDDVPEEVKQEQKAFFLQEIDANKPPEIKEKILQGKLEQFYKQNCLLSQPYIKDDKITVEDLIKQKIGVLKENIKVGKFVRLTLGA
ncbi:elongation factor Ts [bacterium]|nr:elongation factor Ts [bacterium]